MPNPSTVDDDGCTHCQPLRDRIAHLLEVIDTAAVHQRASLQLLDSEAAPPAPVPADLADSSL